MSIKNIILKKGWAGRTISRTETVAQLNPLIQFMCNLLHVYHRLMEKDKGSSGKSSMTEHVSILAMDIGKMCETVASCGGISTRSPQTTLVDGPREWNDIEMAEKLILKMILDEEKIEHQMRTRAILSKVAENVESRLHQLSLQVQA